MLYHLSVIKIQRFPFSCVAFTEWSPGLCRVQAAKEVGVGGGGAVGSTKALKPVLRLVLKLLLQADIRSFHLLTACLSSSA